MYKELMAVLESGDLEAAKKIVKSLQEWDLQRHVIDTALGTVLEWINHPEYVRFVGLEQGIATVEYRSQEYQFPFPSEHYEPEADLDD